MMFRNKFAAMMAVILTASLAASAAEPTNPGKPQARTDAYGDPLPDGAVRRLGTLRFRHGGGTLCNLLLSKDGKTLVSNTYYGPRTVCVWDMATGKLLHQFPGTYHHQNIALSPDGKLVAAGHEKAIFLWDLASGKEVRRLQANMDGFAFSPDGKILATAGAGIHLWDIASGKRIAKFPWRPMGASLLAFTPDGKSLIAGQHFGSKIGVWDVASRKKRHELDAQGGATFFFALSPDGAILATGSRQGGIPLWDVKTGQLIRKLRTQGRIACTAVAFAPDGKTLAAHETADQKDIVSFWDVASGKELPRPKGDIEAFWNLVFTPDGKTLITGRSRAICLWDLATGKEIGPAARSSAYTDVATLSPDGRTLAYQRDDEIRFWDMRASREIGAINAGSRGIRSLAFAPDGRTVAASVGAASINFWDVRTRRLLRRFQGDKKKSPRAFWAVSEIAFAPDSQVLASADAGAPIIRLWDISTGKQIRQFTVSDPPAPKNIPVDLSGVAFSPDGRLLAASGRIPAFEGSKVAICEAATGKELLHLTWAMNDPAQKDEPSQSPESSLFEHKTIFPKVVFSPNGRMLAKNARPKTIAIWEAATGRQRLLLKGHDDSTVCIAFAPDGRTLASASWDETIRLWDLDTGRELRKLMGHRGKANSLAFSADGTILVSAGDDTTILFWDVADTVRRKRPYITPLAAKDWQTLWEELAKDEAATAYAAMIRMSADAPTTLAALKTRLRPILPADPQRLARLFKELDSDEFAMREAANRELMKLGDVAGPAVRQMLARPGLSLEMRRRLETISTSLEEIAGERLRQLRAVEILEWIGTKEARAMLKSLAAGVAEAGLTAQAKAALGRLAKPERK